MPSFPSLTRPLHHLTAKKQEDVITETDKIIIVLGACGSGKTQFINTVVGDRVLDVGADLKIKTREIQHVRCHIEDIGDVVLVDTPALPSPEPKCMTPEQIEKGLEKWLENAIIDNKLTDRVFLHRGMLRTLCGGRYAKRTILVTTMWETLAAGDQSPVSAGPTPKARKEKRELEIKDKHWNRMELDGAPPMHRHDGSTQSAREVIKVLLERDEVDQPVILLLGQRTEDQSQFIQDLAQASDMQIDLQGIESVKGSRISTVFKNFPVSKESADDQRDQPSILNDAQVNEDDDKKVAIISLPPIDHPRCSAEVKRLYRSYGRDIIAFLYLAEPSHAAETIHPESLPSVLVEVPNSNLIIASKIQQPSSPKENHVKDEHISEFERLWADWNFKATEPEGAYVPISLPPVLRYEEGGQAAFDIVSMIYRMSKN
ncbi:hypothetical protein CVT24_002844 [Panaeolus cyanescens]|uniref:G domain-containing protein n=1 Tax=Panaeolus cyanescens TaxID=181874 RepID=A0A409VMT4_9AGAR|nr:hypothetical protein CVT24_002844 [Panaeolus cyanescens]